MTDLIACCGTDCTKCEGYLATQADDDEMRAEVAKKWSAMYNADIKQAYVNCDGCLSDGRKIPYCTDMCEIRKCCIAKDNANCGACDEYPCEKLNGFFQVAPQARTALDALRDQA